MGLRTRCTRCSMVLISPGIPGKLLEFCGKFLNSSKLTKTRLSITRMIVFCCILCRLNFRIFLWGFFSHFTSAGKLKNSTAQLFWRRSYSLCFWQGRVWGFVWKNVYFLLRRIPGKLLEFSYQSVSTMWYRSQDNWDILLTTGTTYENQAEPVISAMGLWYIVFCYCRTGLMRYFNRDTYDRYDFLESSFTKTLIFHCFSFPSEVCDIPHSLPPSSRLECYTYSVN